MEAGVWGFGIRLPVLLQPLPCWCPSPPQTASVSKNVAFSLGLGRACVGLGVISVCVGGCAKPPELAQLVGRAPWDPDTKPSMCLMELGVSLGCRFAAFWEAERDPVSAVGGQAP